MTQDATLRVEPAGSPGSLRRRARLKGTKGLRRLRALPLLVVLAWPAASLAVLPLLIALGHQIIKDMVMNEVKGQLIASLAGMGCKGARIAGLVAAASTAGHGPGHFPVPGGIPGGATSGLAKGPSAPAGMGGGGGLAGAAAGTAPGALGGGASPGGSGGIGGLFRKLTGKGSAGAMPGGGMGIQQTGHMDLPTVAPGTQPSMGEAMAAMQRQHPGMGGGATLSPEQMEQAQGVMAEMQDATNHPLSRPETIEVFDELARLGILTDAMHAEAVECILLAPLGSDQAVGSTGSMMKVVVLPRLRETKEKLSNLAPEEQDQLADGVVQGLHEASPTDRKAFLEGLGAGFFPPPVVEKVRARLH